MQDGSAIRILRRERLMEREEKAFSKQAVEVEVRSQARNFKELRASCRSVHGRWLVWRGALAPRESTFLRRLLAEVPQRSSRVPPFQATRPARLFIRFLLHCARHNWPFSLADPPSYLHGIFSSLPRPRTRQGYARQLQRWSGKRATVQRHVLRGFGRRPANQRLAILSSALALDIARQTSCVWLLD
jgi:hypothetical protein